METAVRVIEKRGRFPCSKVKKSEGVEMENIGNLVTTIAMAIVAVFIVYGAFFQGFLTLGSDVSKIKTNTEKGLERLSDIKITLSYATPRAAALVSPKAEKEIVSLDPHTFRRVEVIFYPGSVSKETEVVLDQISFFHPSPVPKDYQLLANFILGPETLSLNEPIAVKISLTEADFEAMQALQRTIDSLEVLSWTASPTSHWVAVEDFGRHPLTKSITLKIKQMGYYALAINKT